MTKKIIIIGGAALAAVGTITGAVLAIRKKSKKNVNKAVEESKAEVAATETEQE